MFFLALAIISMFILLIHRYFYNRRLSKKENRKNILLPLIFSALDDPESYSTFKNSLCRGDDIIISEIAEELYSKLKGDYLERLSVLLKDSGLKDLYKSLARSRFWWKRLEACRGLGFFKDPDVIEDLNILFNDDVYEVRLEAARSLVLLGQSPSIKELFDKLVNDQKPPGKQVLEIFESLSGKSIDELLDVFRKTENVNVRLIILDALGKIGDLKAIPIIIECMESENPALRVSAVRIAMEFHDPRTIPNILKLLNDQNWEVRAQAARAAGVMKLESAIPFLESLLNDPSWWVRYNAADSLYKIGKKGLAVLTDACKGPFRRSAEIAMSLLIEKQNWTGSANV
jgi:HEAT repeat protein